MKVSRILFLTLILGMGLVTVHMVEGERGVPLRLEICTTSDWTLLNITGLHDVRLFEVVGSSEGHEVNGVNHGDHVTLWIGKEQYDEQRVCYSIQMVVTDPMPMITVMVQKGYIGYTSVKVKSWLLDHYQVMGQISHRLTRNDPETNKISLDIDLSRVQSQFIWLMENPVRSPEVVAAYYGWYGGDGRHWGSIMNGSSTESFNFPQRGAYDSGNRVTIKHQVVEARMAGVTCFACSWWGVDSFEDNVTAKVCAVSEELGFKFTILYESIRDQELTSDMVSDELNYLVRRYGASPAFIKWKNTPVVFIFSPSSYDRDSSFWKEVREKLTMKVFLVGDIRAPELLEVFDGVFHYNELDVRVHRENMKWISDMGDYITSTSYEEFLRETKRYGYAILGDRLTCGTVTPGYDDSKIRMGGIRVPRNNIGAYRGYWENIHSFDVDWVFITSWNEWHEGTEIEPSNEHGYRYLMETRKQVTKWMRYD